MSALTPDKLQALQALLQQISTSAQEEVTVNVPVNIRTSAFPLDNLSRLLVIEGTAVQAKLDEIVLRTAQGEVNLKLVQPKDQSLLQVLPSRVSLQLRPGPNGLEAVLVVGNKAIQQQQSISDAAVHSSANALSTRQTLTADIPKAGQVFGVTVLPNSLLSKMNQQPKGGGHAPVQLNATPVGELSASNPVFVKAAAPQNIINSFLQTLGIPVPDAGTDHIQIVQSYGAATALPKNLAQAAEAGPLNTNFKIIQVQLPESMAKQGAQNQAPNTPVPQQVLPDDEHTVTATVRGAAPSGQQILSVDDALLAVRSNKNWPIGTKLTIAIGPGSGLVTEKEALQAASTSWEGVKQMLDALGLAHPAAAQDMARMRMPQTNAPQQLGGALLFFLTAMKNGDMSSWLGRDNLNQLESLGRIDILRRMQEEWQARSQTAHDAAGSEWRGTHIPYLEQDKLRQFSFYVHEDGHKKQKKDDPDAWARRFLIDVSLSRLGPVQVDGLVHKRKLDLIVRTDNALPDDLRQDLRQVFHKSMEDIQYAGSLIFQIGKRSFVALHEQVNTKITKEI